MTVTPLESITLQVVNDDLIQFTRAGGGMALRERVKVAAFSPPYKVKDGYSDELMRWCGNLLAKALQPGGWVFMNFGQLKEDFLRPLLAWDAMLGAYVDSELIPHQVIVWVKSYSPGPGEPCRGHCQPLNSPNLLNYSWEYIFTAYKPLADGSAPPFDRLAVGVPFADQSNLTRGSRGKNGNLRCAGDVWVVPYATTGATEKKSHVYEWPAALVERMLRVAGVAPGDTVLDPFLGAGQTALVAKRLGCHAVGIERDPARAALARQRWEAS